MMRDYNFPWAIAGGWAIDLFIGEVTRTHDDIEIMIFRSDQLAIQQYLSGWKFYKVQGGKITTWKQSEVMVPPVHETYAERENEKIEILLNETDGVNWIYRRDTRVSRELSKAIIVSDAGMPILSPEIALLYKSKNPKQKDEQDFQNTYPHMNLDQKHWFREALKILYVDHSWISLN